MLLVSGEPARAVEVGPITIAVPEGFEGPASSKAEGGLGGLIEVWVRRRPASQAVTLLQISLLELGPELDEIKGPQRYEAARHYLLEFVKGVAQRSHDLDVGEVEPVTLAGRPAARVRWTGKQQDDPAIGVMYCVFVHHSLVNLQTQDSGSVITPEMYTALAAIDAIQVR